MVMLSRVPLRALRSLGASYVKPWNGLEPESESPCIHFLSSSSALTPNLVKLSSKYRMSELPDTCGVNGVASWPARRARQSMVAKNGWCCRYSTEGAARNGVRPPPQTLPLGVKHTDASPNRMSWASVWSRWIRVQHKTYHDFPRIIGGAESL